MSKVWLAQLKCPSNHTVIALAGELQDKPPELLSAALEFRFDDLVNQGLLNRECGICKSTTLHVEVGRTNYNSMDEALPALAECQQMQMATAQYLKNSRN